MNILVILGVIAVLFLLQTRKLPIICWLFIWPLAIYLLVRFGIEVHVPASVLKIYLWLTLGGVVSYIYADDERYTVVASQLHTFICDDKYTFPRLIMTILLPVLFATKIYFDVNVEPRAATFGRTVHPAPPGNITVNGNQIDLISGKNPYRELEESDKEAFAKHLENGKRVYYQNCVYCHGDDMGGDGIFAHALAPVPANFNSATTISQLQEAYLYWRLAKGGPGLPDESGPWSSSMPAWEKFLTEEEMWDVILYLYDYTGYTPRAEEEHH